MRLRPDDTGTIYEIKHIRKLNWKFHHDCRVVVSTRLVPVPARPSAAAHAPSVRNVAPVKMSVESTEVSGEGMCVRPSRLWLLCGRFFLRSFFVSAAPHTSPASFSNKYFGARFYICCFCLHI